MARYLLNLSSDFDADGLLPVFLPYIADGSINLFDELTKYSLPEHNQAHEIESRIREIRKHFENRRLFHEENLSSIELGIIIGFEDWDFTGFGKLSRIPLFKVMYLRSLIDKNFGRYKDIINIQYYITGIKSKPYIAIFSHLEITGYLPEERTLPEESIKFNWIRGSDLYPKKPSKPNNLKGINESSPLTTALKESIVSYSGHIRGEFTKSFEALHFCDMAHIKKVTQDLEMAFDHIKTIGEFIRTDFKKLTDSFMKRQFTLSENLKNNETSFKYLIDETNVIANLRSRIAFSCLVLESLTNNIFTTLGLSSHECIMSVELDDENFQSYLTELKNLIEHNIDQISKVDDGAKKTYKVYSLDNNDIVRKYPELTAQEINEFKLHSDIKNAIGSFFDFNIRSNVKRLFEKKNIGKLEEKVFSRINEAFFTPDFQELHSQEEKITINQARNKLEEMVLNQPELITTTGHELYFSDKNDLEPQINSKRYALLKSVGVLPRLSTVAVIIGAGTIAMLLFAFPLFNFYYPISASAAAIAILALSTLSVPLLLRKVKTEIYSLIEELEVLNDRLLKSLQDFRTRIIEAAIKYKDTVIFRKNVQELQRIIDEHNVLNQKKHEYSTFLKELNNQLDLFPEFSTEEIRQKRFEKTIEDFDVSPTLNRSFTRPVTSTIPKKISFRYPNNVTMSADYSSHSFIHHIEFE